MQHIFIFSTCYSKLRDAIRTSLGDDTLGTFTCVKKQDHIRYVRISSTELPVVQVAITVDYDFLPKVLVHNIPLEKDSGFWDNMPKRVTCVEDFQQILRKLDDFSVCAGNFEPHFEHLLIKGVPAGKIGAKSEYCGYKEWDFGELHQSNRLNSTMRSMRCALLHKDAPRCGACTKFRKTPQKSALTNC